MSEKNFCDAGKHEYKEIDIVKSVFEDYKDLHIVVACSKCDSKFLRTVASPL